MNMNGYSYLLSFGLCLASVACGSDPPPDTEPNPEALDYYPLVDGRELVYFHDGSGGWDETITVTQNADGTFLEKDTPNPSGVRTETVLMKDAAGRIIRTHQEEYASDVLDFSVDYSGGTYGGFLRYDPAWASMEVGETVTVDYDRTETPAGGAAEPSRARSHIFTRFEMETVTLASSGETFQDCLKIQRARNYVDTLGMVEDQTKMFWFAAGVGKVFEQTVTGGSGSEQLIQYPEQGN